MRVKFFNLSVDLLSPELAVEKIQFFITRERFLPHQIITLNTLMVSKALGNAGFAGLISQSALVIPESAGVSWALNFLGYGKWKFLPGIELMDILLRMAAEEGWRIFFLGGSKETINRLEEKITEDFPNLSGNGYADGYFSAGEESKIIDQINTDKPQLLFVALGSPRQEFWIQRNLTKLGATVVLGVGGSFDVLAGCLPRAPAVFRRFQMEWLYRLIRQPWRFLRMLRIFHFVCRVFTAKIKPRRG